MSNGIDSKFSRSFYSAHTHDVQNLNAWRDDHYATLFMDEFYTGDVTYIGMANTEISEPLR